MQSQLDPIDWDAPVTRYMLFTGKGGVGKTTIAAATAVRLADRGRRVLVVSTDPASNLDDVLGTRLGDTPIPISGVAGLSGVNIDPLAAAEAYRQRTLAPFTGIVPDDELDAMTEQLSGQCTVEIAAFDEFSVLLGSDEAGASFDHVIFDTAPTGHTLRLLSLPSAWSKYLVDSPAGASCLGPLATLDDKRQLYEDTVSALGDPAITTVWLVSRPERSALREAARAASELRHLGIDNQRLVINGVLDQPDADDAVAPAYSQRQQEAIVSLPPPIDTLASSFVPLTPIELTGVSALRALVGGVATEVPAGRSTTAPSIPPLEEVVADLDAAGPRVTMVMGKGGVGKTTIAAAIAVGLAETAGDVLLATTDPAGRFTDVLDRDIVGLEVTRIDAEAELARYVESKLRAARDLEPDQRALLEEDLRSPCTQEIAVFQRFSALLREGRRRHVVIDTAPSGHTLLLLDQTGAYHHDVMRGTMGVAGRVTTPLMRIRDPDYTRVLIVALAEATPVQEAADLQADLARADITPYGWVINASLSATGTTDAVLGRRAGLETPHIERVQRELAERVWLVPWLAEPTVDAVLETAPRRPGSARQSGSGAATVGRSSVADASEEGPR
jgi:arsenite/tail-anchored protein-transporting ATPase